MSDFFEEQQKTAEAKSMKRYLSFTLSKEQYAIPLLEVKEVIAMTEATPIPYAPSYFKGIINLRGQVISVVDLRSKLRLNNAEDGSETSIIILDLAPLCLGVIVDSIDSVLALSDEEISPAPDVTSQISEQFLTGVARKNEKLILLLDISSTLNLEDIKTLKSQAVPQRAA